MDTTNLATKDDLAKFATKDDLVIFELAMKEDLVNFELAMKADMQKYAESARTDSDRILTVLINMEARFQRNIDNHDQRIKVLEKRVLV